MDCEQVKQQFQTLEQTWQQQGELSIDTRRDYLNRLLDMLVNHSEEIAASLNEDFSHRAKNETYFLELFPTIQAIKYCRNHMKGWAKRRRRKISILFKPARAYIQPQALGIVGNLSPWNYPINLALVPAAYAIAAGNRVMIKFSEFTPKTGALMERLIKEAFPEGDLLLINGGVEVAQCFSSLPFGHLIFTGSTQVGRHVMRAASDNLTPVTLELGGKSPAFISSTANDDYMDRLLIGKCFNSGQTCIAPDYVILPKGYSSRFEELAKSFVSRRYPTMPDDSHYTSIVSQEHFDRLLNIIDDAQAKGARVVSFGEVNKEKRKIPLTLVLGVSEEMVVMQEEIFGPILPVIEYDNFEQAVSLVDKHPSPLSLYYFGHDKSEMELLRKRQLSGCLTINDTVIHFAVDELPFGGVGNSGIGRYHGQEGFNRFSLLKPIFIQSQFSAITWLYPPYGKLMKFFLKYVAKLNMKAD